MRFTFLWILLKFTQIQASLESCQKLILQLAVEVQIEGLIPVIQKSAPYLQYSGKNINDFGLYESCLRNEYLYSSVIIKQTGFWENFYGLCHNQNCTTNDLNTPLAKEMIKQFLNQSGIADMFNISVSQLDYQMIDPQQPLFDNFEGMTIVITLLFLLFFATLALPIWQFLFHFKTRKQRYQITYKAKPNINVQTSMLNQDCEASDLVQMENLSFNPKDSQQVRVLKDFSIIENYRKLTVLSTQDANLTIFDGYRTLAFLMVIFGHQFEVFAAATYKLELFREFQTWLHLNMINMLYSVDIFFWIGGFFIGFVLYDQKQTNQIIKNPASLLIIILHRLLRIWPCYILAIMINQYIGPHLGSGPRWFQSQQGFECKTGWRNILFIDNWFNDGQYCFEWGWYLSNDIQMFLVNLIPLFIYAKFNKTMGKVIVISLLLATQITGTIVTYYYQFLIPVFALQDPNQKSWYYLKPYCRAPPYFLGLILGIMYREHKAYQQISSGKMPALSQLQSLINGTTKRRIFLLISYGAGVLIIFTIWFGWRDIHLNKSDYSQKFQSFWFAFCRITFCLGLSFLTLPNLLGMQDVFNTTIMGNRLFKFLSKISFTGYLLHFIFLVITISAFYQTPSFNFANNFTYFVGNTFLTIIFATLLTLVVEMPFAKLEQRLIAQLTSGKKEITQGPDLSDKLLKH